MVAVSIGGNNFHFGEIVARCIYDFTVAHVPCRTDNEVTRWITPERVAENQAEIRRAIEEVRRAMLGAGNLDNEFVIMVQGYEQLLPFRGDFRYDEANRWLRGGCGFYDDDADWANRTLVPMINRTIWDATKQLPFANFRRLDVSWAFGIHKLCHRDVRLIEEAGYTSWSELLALSRLEWVRQVRIADLGEQLRQESLHPNSFGQRALRSCLRLAYDNGAPRSGQCVDTPGPETPWTEPTMWLNPFNP
jgi:hypothetical protein